MNTKKKAFICLILTGPSRLSIEHYHRDTRLETAYRGDGGFFINSKNIWKGAMTSNTATKRGPLVIGCVTEPVQKYIQQAARLLLSVRWFGGKIADAPFILCTTGKLPAPAESFFTSRGAKIVAVERVSPKHGPSNKIRFLEQPTLDNWQHILLLDCDTIVAQDPSAFLSCPGLAAKIADAPTVTTDDFQQLFSMFGMELPAERYQHDFVAKPCIPYFNSGVILLNSAWRERFVTAWNTYNNTILEEWDSISMQPFYTDQASLTLAIESIGIPVKPLPSSMNLGCHWPAHGYPPRFGLIDPLIIHYHSLFDENGYITRTPLEQTNRRIDAFNARLRAEKLASDSMRHFSRTVNHKVETSEQPTVVVGSRWRCEDKDLQRAAAAAATTKTMFFYLWYTQVLKCLSPSTIVITDSYSPLKPDYQSFELIHWIELDCSGEHTGDNRTGTFQTNYPGFTASLINGCVYALSCAADYYVYVAQDCLLKGDNFLTAASGGSSADILVAVPTEDAKNPLREPVPTMNPPSLMILKRSGMERLISGLLRADCDDERASSDIITLERHLQPLGTVQTPYGGSRPIDFDQSHFYAHDLSQDELDKFIAAADLSALNNNVVSKPFYETL